MCTQTLKIVLLHGSTAIVQTAFKQVSPWYQMEILDGYRACARQLWHQYMAQLCRSESLMVGKHAAHVYRVIFMRHMNTYSHEKHGTCRASA